jgi:hypothetical protein
MFQLPRLCRAEGYRRLSRLEKNTVQMSVRRWANLTKNEDYILLEYDAVQAGRNSLTFQRNMLPPTLEQKTEAACSSETSLNIIYTAWHPVKYFLSIVTGFWTSVSHSYTMEIEAAVLPIYQLTSTGLHGATFQKVILSNSPPWEIEISCSYKLQMVVAHACEMSSNIYQTTRNHISCNSTFIINTMRKANVTKIVHGFLSPISQVRR